MKTCVVSCCSVIAMAVGCGTGAEVDLGQQAALRDVTGTGEEGGQGRIDDGVAKLVFPPGRDCDVKGELALAVEFEHELPGEQACRQAADGCSSIRGALLVATDGSVWFEPGFNYTQARNVRFPRRRLPCRPSSRC